MPNRFESAAHPVVSKLYLDGDMPPEIAGKFQNPEVEPELNFEFEGLPLKFRRPLNPHSGCFFLSAEQMEHWSNQPHFLDRDSSFVGPAQSAATLGVMKAFRVYKSAPENAHFLEIQHGSAEYLSALGNRIPYEDGADS